VTAPTNGHASTSVLVSETLEPVAEQRPARPIKPLGMLFRRLAPSKSNEATATEPQEVAALRRQRDIAQALVEIQDDEALQLALSPRERHADRRVAQRVRRAERRERSRTGIDRVRVARRNRGDDLWSARARRARERLLNPNRRLAATYRRYIALSSVTAVLIVIGVVWMSATVHDGLVGVDGSLLAYLVEPMASSLLVVSMIAQFTAVENGEKNPWWFIALDGGLAAASLLLNIVPWGLRYGWEPGPLLSHALPPLLIAAAVLVNHMLNRLFSAIFSAVHVELDDTLRLNEETADVLVLVERTRRAIANGQLTVDEHGMPSKEAIRRRFGIGKQRAQLTGDALELIQTL
jgi:hypothetical protein